MNENVYDIAVIGSGFAGSLLAAIARRLGRSVVLLEKGKHPRFAIGESSTPLANLLLEDLTTRYDLPALTPLAKWGSWQRTHPQIACGLKRGFTFYHHTLGAPAPSYADRTKQLLVAASPHDKIADTHWYRADFDQFFVQQAQNAGVEYIDEVQLKAAAESEHELTIHGARNFQELTIHARFVVDATGPRGFLHRAFDLSEIPLPGFPATQALYNHFSEVSRLPEEEMNLLGGVPPYPVEDAAVHHIFDGGWVWVLHFNNGVTSAGVAITDALKDRLRLEDGEPAWQRLLHLLPPLKSQFAHANLERSFTHIPRLSFRSSAIAGKRWVLLPSAAGFVDPLLSTGFALSLLGVSRLAEIIEQDWETEEFAKRLQTYAANTDNELLASARLIGALYRNMGNFPLFTSLSLLYFATVSYSETARRLRKPRLASSFLLHDHPSFGPQLLRLFGRLSRADMPLDSARLNEEILAMVEPFNVAGLGETHRRNWYPVEADDLLRGAWKLEASRDEISQLLDRSGFWPSP